MRESLIKQVHELLFEFVPLYHQKFSVGLRRPDNIKPECNKNQKRAIFIINRFGKVTATELGKWMDMRKGSLTTLIDGLEEMNLVERITDPTDRRKVLISLTEEGVEYVKKKTRAYQQFLDDLLKHKSDEEIEGFLKSIRNIVEFMKTL